MVWGFSRRQLNRLKYFLLSLQQGIFSFDDFEEIIACEGKDLDKFSQQIVAAQNKFLGFMNVKDSKLVSAK